MIVYLNGKLVERADATVSPFDRGFLFGDGVYEGLRSYKGRVFALAEHVERLAAGLEATRIRGFSARELGAIAGALIDANAIPDAFIYVQVTRGTPPIGDPPRERRASPGTHPTVFAYAAPTAPLAAERSPAVLSAAAVPDHRWRLGQVKGVSLLGNVMAAYDAAELDADDGVLVLPREDGSIDDACTISEATATNIFASINGEIVTPALSSAPMLSGVTRRVLVRELGGRAIERKVTLGELRAADEIAVAGTRTMVARIGTFDGQPAGECGLASELLDVLRKAIQAELDLAYGHG